MHGYGYAEYDKERVIGVCERYLRRRAHSIEKAKEKFIAKKMEPRSFLFGLIKVKGYTREEAEHRWENDDSEFFTPRERAEMICENEYYAVRSLLNLARSTSGRTVSVSSDMAHLFLS